MDRCGNPVILPHGDYDFNSLYRSIEVKNEGAHRQLKKSKDIVSTYIIPELANIILQYTGPTTVHLNFKSYNTEFMINSFFAKVFYNDIKYVADRFGVVSLNTLNYAIGRGSVKQFGREYKDIRFIHVLNTDVMFFILPGCGYAQSEAVIRSGEHYKFKEYYDEKNNK